MNFKTISKDEITVTNAAVVTLASGTLGAIPAAATGCIIQVRDAPVSEWHDGSTPTTTAGMVWNPPGFYKLTTKDDMTNFKVIATTATNALLSVSYEGLGV